MLNLLKISNVALISELSLEFGPGLNLLTGETGSGKSIIVDSLGALIGARVSSELIKQGETSARIEGLFSLNRTPELMSLLDDAGIAIDETDAPQVELIVKREISGTGKNRIFINGQLTTLSILRSVGSYLADIHGQGEQAMLFDTRHHRSMLDDYAGNAKLAAEVEAAFSKWTSVRSQLDMLRSDEAEKLQLVDILRFQVDEISRIAPRPGEDDELEEEKRRVGNAEKLSTLSGEAYRLLYDQEESSLSTLERARRSIAEIAEFDAAFREYDEALATANAVIEDAAIAARDFAARVEFSPERLDEIEERLAHLASIKRKYGGSIASALEHLEVSTERLANIESSELRESELTRELSLREKAYLESASRLSSARLRAAKKFGAAVEKALSEVALEKAKFEVRVEADTTRISADGIDTVEFYFSANPGEVPQALAKVASGGEASRIMLVLKTTARGEIDAKSAVFDEIDVGIGGRVAEAVGRKLKGLAASQQVLCVTHQPQIASLADEHFVIEKSVARARSMVIARALSQAERVEEIARMLAGEKITDAARENARSMLAGAG